MAVDFYELWIGRLGALTGLLTLGFAIWRMILSLRQPAGRIERGARFALRNSVLLVALVLFLVAGAVLWHPLPIYPSTKLRLGLLILGAVLFFGGLVLYLWGLWTLDSMFGPSSGFGVRLHANHRLVTSGPFAYMRHPMYLGVIVAAIGSLLLYRTWATLWFAILMFGLVVRARREEQILAQEFGVQWSAYASRVPRWLPQYRRERNR